MLKKIREAMRNGDLELFKDISEIDETYVSGELRKGVKKKDKDDDDTPSDNARGRRINTCYRHCLIEF